MPDTRDLGAALVARQAAVLLAATLIGALFLISHEQIAVAAAVLVLLALTLLIKEPRARGLAVLAASLYLIVGPGVFGLWPLSGVVAVGVAFGTARVLRVDEAWRPWLRSGRWTTDVPWTVLALVCVTGFALVAWQRLFDGRPPQEYVESAGGRSVGVIIAAGLLFSLVNAAVEEAIFRGVLQEAATAAYGVPLGILLQAIAFGSLHLIGVPSGVLGAVMAGGWGLALGLLRWRTEGIVAPYVAHVAADLTIVLMLLPVLTEASR